MATFHWFLTKAYMRCDWLVTGQALWCVVGGCSVSLMHFNIDEADFYTVFINFSSAAIYSPLLWIYFPAFYFIGALSHMSRNEIIINFRFYYIPLFLPPLMKSMFLSFMRRKKSVFVQFVQINRIYSVIWSRFT